jgi:hypothetical protein
VAAIFRSLHPVRWALGMAGIALTALAAAAAQALFDGRMPRFAEWFQDPRLQLTAFVDQLSDRSLAGVIVRLGAVAAVVAGIWSLIGAWIARHEVLARYRGRPDSTAESLEPGPTRLVARKPKDLVLGFVLVLILCGVLLVPVALAGAINRLGGGGALLVAVALPVVLVADLILLCLLVGLVAWPLMPVTIAVENSDVFDSLSRAYNYAFTRPVRFVLLTAVTLAVAAAPPAAVLGLLAGPVENWPSAAGHPAVWVAGGLSASLFWSLQTLAYLNLRTAVDGTDADEVAGPAEPTPTAPAPESGQQPTPPVKQEPPARLGLLTQVVIFGMMLVTWGLTAWMFARFGGEDAGWLGWGVGEHFRPPAEGAYWYASLLAGAWGAIWVAAPILVAVRQALRSDSQDPTAKPSVDSGIPPGRC